jgi:hypothetical protein
MKSAMAQESLELSCDQLGVVKKTTAAFLVERRIIAFFKMQIDTMPKNDCTAGYLSGELMAWGLIKAISKETEDELESLLSREWRVVHEAGLQS